MFAPARADKLALSSTLDRWLEEALVGLEVPAGAPRVFTYPLDDTVTAFQTDAYLDEPVLHPELWATHQLLAKLFTGPLAAPGPDAADLCFLPLFLPAYEIAGVALADTIAGLELVDSGRPHLLSSLWDGYPRPPSARANPFSMQSLGHQVAPDHLDTAWSWLDGRFRVFTLESSIDVHPNDVNITPLVLPGPRRQPGLPAPLLYSFCGATTYQSVPHHHVRGQGNEAVWARLGLEALGDAFVGSLDAARQRFGGHIELRTLPAMSRFTLCPAGWSRWSYRLVEAIDAGSIPVVLSDYSVRPFSDQLDWDTFSLSVPEEALPEIDELLRALHPARVAALEAGVQRVRGAFGPRGLAQSVLNALRVAA